MCDTCLWVFTFSFLPLLYGGEIDEQVASSHTLKGEFCYHRNSSIPGFFFLSVFRSFSSVFKSQSWFYFAKVDYKVGQLSNFLVPTPAKISHEFLQNNISYHIICLNEIFFCPYVFITKHEMFTLDSQTPTR